MNGRLRYALAAALAGMVMLAVWFPRYWPAVHWKTIPRAQMLAKSREIAQHFGLNTSGWKAEPVTSVSKSLAYYAWQHPDDPGAKIISPLAVRLGYADGEAAVGLDSAGLPLYWHAPDGFKSKRKFASDEAAAHDAFAYLAGADAAAYKNPVRSAGEESNEQQYEWKKPLPVHSEIRERITVVCQNGVVKSAEHRAYLASDEDGNSDSGDSRAYWNVLDGTFGLVCTSASVIMIAIYALWIARKAISHQFPLRLAGVVLLFQLLALGVGSSTQQVSSIYRKEDGNGSGGWIFSTLLLLGFVAVGRGISANARPKWMTLEQLCRLVPVAKAAGLSIAAGVLFSPLLIAIPYLVAGCGLMPGAWVLPQKMELLYLRGWFGASFNLQQDTYLLGFFGFGVPALERFIRPRWLAWLIVVTVGTMFFAAETRVVTGPLASPLVAGFLTLALFWVVYSAFDLLAVLTLPLATGMVLTIAMLWQAKIGNVPGLAMLILSLLLIVSYLVFRRGTVTPAGDPQASLPALSGFRAEREKLRAEFSLARRAQQDMLPQTPPVIPGYSIAASCTPSLEVGGDLYDFLKLRDGRIGIGVADVSGKGVPAALYMTLTKGLLAAVTKNSAELARVVEEVNRHLHSVTRKKVFVTMALGFLDAEKRVMECVRAGHNPMVWRQTKRALTTLVAPGGLGLGITAGRVFSTQLKVAEMALNEGDAVVFYSDGITEAMNSGLEQFGEQRLMDAVDRTDHLDAAATRDSILGEVKDFLNGVHPQDDMTLVVLRVGESARGERMTAIG